MQGKTISSQCLCAYQQLDNLILVALRHKHGDSMLEFMVPFAHEHLLPLQGQIDLLDQEREIVPGVHAIAAPGHTPGRLALAIASGDQHLMHLADVVGHPIHVEHPEWFMSVDILPEQAVTTRRELLQRAVAKQSMVSAFHLPFPGIGHIITVGERWQWQPLQMLEESDVVV